MLKKDIRLHQPPERNSKQKFLMISRKHTQQQKLMNTCCGCSVSNTWRQRIQEFCQSSDVQRMMQPYTGTSENVQNKVESVECKGGMYIQNFLEVEATLEIQILHDSRRDTCSTKPKTSLSALRSLINIQGCNRGKTITFCKSLYKSTQ